MVDSSEPDCDVRDESHFMAELSADFFFVDVVGEGVGDEVVGQDIDVVLWGWFGAGTGVAGNTKDCGGGGEVGDLVKYC